MESIQWISLGNSGYKQHLSGFLIATPCNPEIIPIVAEIKILSTPFTILGFQGKKETP
jgi:hypothetical protein